MSGFLLCRCALLAVLVSSVAVARSPDDKIVIRTLMVAQHPGNSTDNIYVSGEVATVLRFEKDIDPTNMGIEVETFSGPGKAAVVIRLTNTYNEEPWRFRDARLSSDLTSNTSLPFALRLDQAEIVPGQSGTIAVVADQSAFKSKEGLRDLALEIFRQDGLRQVVVNLDHTLVRK